MRGNLEYPSGAEFAFTILDDTDDTTVNNGRPVYDLLKELNMRTTKTVWTFDTTPENQGPYFAGETLSSPEYLHWVHELAESGFEIAFHNATMGSSLRGDTIRALDFLENEFGLPIQLHCNHGKNKENLYWGEERYNSKIIKWIFSLFSKYRKYPNPVFEGSTPDSPYYWSDIAAKRLSYMRAFAFRRINGMLIPPGRPFCDPVKQRNPLLFNTADAPDVQSFNNLVNPASIDKLRKQRGWAIISTHLGKGFCRDNKVNSEFQKTMQYLSSQPGWFVPASQLLEFLKTENGVSDLSGIERTRMEYAHIIDRVYNKLF